MVVIAATLIGLTLGLLGSGGSALTVPVLVYLVGHGGKVSIAESTAIVGVISVAAAIPYGRRRLIDWNSVVYFGIPGMLGTFVGAWLGGVASEMLQLIVFGMVLMLAAASMLTKASSRQSHSERDINTRCTPPIWKVACEGMVVGMVTGFVGVGGGFLIVPALVILGHLPMRLAVGTSLVIIAAKSLVGFAKYQHYLMGRDLSVDVTTILTFAGIGILGTMLGQLLNQRIPQRSLARVFAVFLIALGSFVIIREGSRYFAVGKPAQAELREVNASRPPYALVSASEPAAQTARLSGWSRKVTLVSMSLAKVRVVQ